VPCRRAKWENVTRRAFEKVADTAGLDTTPDTADVEAGHGTAKLDGVIHRYI
jgi:hypothetical protein